MAFGEKKEFVVVTYGAFDDLVREVYGGGYECVVDEEWNNYSCYDFSVDGGVIGYDYLKLQGFITHKNARGGIARIFLNDLARQGKIEKGNYLIKVSW